jgi:hypothetical protein
MSFGHHSGLLRRSAVEINSEKCGVEVVVGNGWVPAVGGEHGGVEFLVDEVEPGGRSL